MAKQISVQAGQQYVKVESTRNPPPVWEVRSIYSSVGNIAHAGLMNPADPLDRKTVSISALLDEKHFRLLKDVGAGPVEQGTRRSATKAKAEAMLRSSKPASGLSGFLRRRATARSPVSN